MFYEDCKLDLATSLKKLAEFLGKPLSDDDLPKLIKHLQFDSFKKSSVQNFKLDPTVASDSNADFIRRGKIGGNSEMTAELSKIFDDWTEENLKNSDLKFPS